LRRRKEENEDCVNCVQFDQSVVLVLERYAENMNYDQKALKWLVDEKVIPELPEDPTKRRTLKRRTPKQRTLKRRTLKRREVVKPRKLKRRKPK
jgi:hypothetical protein